VFLLVFHSGIQSLTCCSQVWWSLGMYHHTSCILLSSSSSPLFDPHACHPTLTTMADYVWDIKGTLPLTSLFACSQAAAAGPCWWHSHHMSNCNHGYPECNHKRCQNASPNGNCNLNPNTNPNMDMKPNRNASPNASCPTMNTPTEQVMMQVPATVSDMNSVSTKGVGKRVCIRLIGSLDV